jgi:uncharacterized protein (TIGR02597 family)
MIQRSANLSNGSLAIACVGLALIGSGATAEGVESSVSLSPMVGVEKLSIAGQGDSRIGVPMLKRPVTIAKIGSVTVDRISFVGVQWANQQFAESSVGRPRYYCEIITGDLRGLILPIISNLGQELEIDIQTNLTAHPAGTLASGANGDVAHIRPCYEIQEVFGAAPGESVLAPVPAVPAAGGAGDHIQVPDNETAGFLKPPKEELFLVTGSGWRSREGGAADQGNYPLLPGQPLTVKMFSAGGADMYVVGHVEEPRVMALIPAGQAREFSLTLRGSQPLSLVNAGLFQSQNIRPSISELERGDELSWFEPETVGSGRSPERRFVYVTGSGWVEVGSPTGAQSFLLQPGEVFVLRKRSLDSDTWWKKPAE